jgi:hypothetical protein
MPESMKAYARAAGVLMIISLLAGAFGEAYAPSRLIVAGDPAATARNVVELDWIFRLGFATYLIEALCDVALALIFYVLLKPVSKAIALLAAFFGLIATATFGAAEIFYFVPPVLLRNAGAMQGFSPQQVQSLVLLSLRIYGLGGMALTAFYGAAWIVRGYLMIRSGYIPGILGILMALGGAGFVIRNFLLVLTPAFASSAFLFLMAPGALAFAVWLLISSNREFSPASA